MALAATQFISQQERVRFSEADAAPDSSLPPAVFLVPLAMSLALWAILWAIAARIVAAW